MITTLVSVEPVTRFGTKYHEEITASAGEEQAVRSEDMSSRTMLLKNLKKHWVSKYAKA
jgi:hypothetical protein